MNLDHPLIGRKVLNRAKQVGTVVAYIGGDFRLEFPASFCYKIEKEVLRMIKHYEDWEKENDQEKRLDSGQADA